MVVAHCVLRCRRGGLIAGANEIRIPVGREVAFTLKSADVIHSFWIPSAGRQGRHDPGPHHAIASARRSAGSFSRPMRRILRRRACADGDCGDRPRCRPSSTRGWKPKQRRRRSRQPMPAGEARHLFLAAGCGACHAVRGTPATGTVGPDLTHVGARRSVGAETLAMTPRQPGAFRRRRPARQARQQHAAVSHFLASGSSMSSPAIS